MYETGGRFNFMAYILLLLAGDFFLQVGNEAWHNAWWWKILLPVLSFSLIGLFLYKFVRFIISLFR